MGKNVIGNISTNLNELRIIRKWYEHYEKQAVFIGDKEAKPISDIDKIISENEVKEDEEKRRK